MELKSCYKCQRLYTKEQFSAFDYLDLTKPNDPNKFCSKKCEQSSEYR